MFSVEEKEEYRRHKDRVGYDKRSRAVEIIRAGFRSAHPNARADTFPRDGICTCGNPIVYDDVKIRIDANGHEYHDHKSCNSWACPVCAPKRARERAEEIEQALQGANIRGLSCYFITFTVPHRRQHSTAYVLKVLDDCYSKTRQDKGIRKILNDNGFAGMIKCKDYTLTDNGTHAHLHCIWLFDDVEDPAVFADYLGAALRDKWDRLVYRETGRHIHSKYGFDLEYIDLGAPGDPDAERIAHYAAKSISVYVSETDKGKSRSPFDLLSASATDEDRARYLDWYKGQKGKRHIMFSPGLKKLLGVGKVEHKPADNAVIAWIGYDNAFLLKDVNVKHEFEDRAAASISAALDWLDEQAAAYRDGVDRRFSVGSLYSADVWTVKYDGLVQELDDTPRADWVPVLSRYRVEQDEIFPATVQYWKMFHSVHGRELLREYEYEHGRSDEGKRAALAAVEEKMNERAIVRDRLEHRVQELSRSSRPRRAPLYTPVSYRKCQDEEERAVWLSRHRDEYRGKAEARLRSSLRAADDDKKMREYIRLMDAGDHFADELFPPSAPAPVPPRRPSGLGRAMQAAGLVPPI